MARSECERRYCPVTCQSPQGVWACTVSAAGQPERKGQSLAGEEGIHGRVMYPDVACQSLRERRRACIPGRLSESA